MVARHEQSGNADSFPLNNDIVNKGVAAEVYAVAC